MALYSLIMLHVVCAQWSSMDS